MVGEKALRTLLSSATNEIGTEISVGLERASASTGYDACTRSGGSLGLRCDRTRLRWQVRSDQRTARRIVGSAISASDRSNHHVPAYMTWSWSCSSCSSHRTRDGVKREASQRDVHVLFREGQTSETSAVILTNIGWGSTPNHSRCSRRTPTESECSIRRPVYARRPRLRTTSWRKRAASSRFVRATSARPNRSVSIADVIPNKNVIIRSSPPTTRPTANIVCG